MADWQKLGDVTERLISKSAIREGSGCWEWTASRFNNGYGKFWHGGENRGAHRVSYELYHGSIPDGMYVCHRCDNPACINPDHLFLGTSRDNAADKVAKERQARGLGHGLAKLTEADIQAIREATDISNIELGKRYGVHNSSISRIRLGKTWAHVDQIFHIELNGPLAEALCLYAQQEGAEPSTIIAEAVRSYMGEGA